MNIKKFIFIFIKNLAIMMAATLVSFTFVVFSLLNSFGDKISYQGGSIGQVIVSVMIAWVAVIAFSLLPLTAISLTVSLIQMKK